MTAETLDIIYKIVALGADLVTLILGLGALWGVIFHRKKLALIVKVLLSNFLNERVKRIKETLGKLESLNFDDKPDRREILALLGQVSGQIKPLITDQNGLNAINQEIVNILDKNTALTEATKRKVVYELHGRLDSIAFAETRRILD